MAATIAWRSCCGGLPCPNGAPTDAARTAKLRSGARTVVVTRDPASACNGQQGLEPGDTRARDDHLVGHERAHAGALVPSRVNIGPR